MRNSFTPTNPTRIDYTSVEQLPNAGASVVFSVDSSQVFKEDTEIAPITLTDGTRYMPWGTDDNLPYHILDLIEKDETLSTCQMFNAEICYGNGLQYNTEACSASVKAEVSDFLLANSLASYFLGVILLQVQSS